LTRPAPRVREASMPKKSSPRPKMLRRAEVEVLHVAAAHLLAWWEAAVRKGLDLHAPALELQAAKLRELGWPESMITPTEDAEERARLEGEVIGRVNALREVLGLPRADLDDYRAQIDHAIETRPPSGEESAT
jgi:hypothetical protein